MASGITTPGAKHYIGAVVNYILVVDDEPAIRNLVKEILEDEGYEVGVAEDGAEARRLRRCRRPDLILLDVWMPDVDGVTLLREWSEGGGLPCPVIVMSGHATVETAVEATRLGAYDFIEKPLSLAKLLLTVERALDAERLLRENAGLKRRSPSMLEPIGKSAVMHGLRDQVKRIARHESPVLITGEPGSGKQTFARFIHACGPRRDGPFVEVGVGSLSRERALTDLFGRERDGVIEYGLLEQANGGTLFIDELADLDLRTQVQLLAALESHSFSRVGSDGTLRLDVRVIAATLSALPAEVAAGRFREDLYYHLNVVPLVIPALREHPEDLPELLDFYVDQFVNHEGLPYRRLALAAQNRLRHYHWPGNIRELKNLVQRLLILATGEEIGPVEVESAIGARVRQPRRPPLPANISFELPLREARERFERAYLEHQLQEAGGSIGRLAVQVGMERTHLYRKLRALGIDPKKVAYGE
ncbi:MAG: transcriptional regulator [Chromatiales bacterium 21-64-14]|nr:MAG: transcriptional regulator [Chromatiales bacterium 21-64-14]HQU14481.1 sigma-54 dependent transcriptional regulator [Gammaproteobacteria bacterium]